MKRNLFLVFSVIVALILVVNGTQRILTYRSTFEKLDAAEERLNKLKEENEALKGELEEKSSDEYAEEAIRNELGLAKEGEIVVVLPGDESSEGTDKDSEANEPNWRKWWSLFFEI